MQQEIAILLCTYNSQKYLVEQIESIISQSYENWKLFIRDDGSLDHTVGIITRYSDMYPERIIIVNDTKKNRGPGNGYMFLLNEVEAAYYMFCDHDDVWQKNKIEVSYNKIAEIEKTTDKPILVFTDLIVVDENLRQIHKSFWEYSKINPYLAKNVYYNSVTNSVTGCTMIINNNVKEFVFPYPEEAIIHDWWINLIISYYGVVDYIEEKTVLYRQHASNAIGAREYSLSEIINRLRKLKITVIRNIQSFKMVKKLPYRISQSRRMIVKYVHYCFLVLRYLGFEFIDRFETRVMGRLNKL
jgi:glycosyltransferase involved in cell wall biosynthesis